MKRGVCILCAALAAAAGAETLRLAGIEFASVEGTSQLPIEHMRSPRQEKKMVAVTLPKFWIAKTMVTEGDFAAFMGRKVRAGRHAKDVLTDIEWDDARAFCDRFTHCCRGVLPPDSIVSLPSVLEWAHAVRRLDGQVPLVGKFGTFLFSGCCLGWYHHTLLENARTQVAREDMAWEFADIPKRSTLAEVGVRLVIVGVDRMMPPAGNAIHDRALVLLEHGDFATALNYLELARERGRLGTNDLAEVDRAIAFARAERRERHEDWSGLVMLAARFAESRGFETMPFCRKWRMMGWDEMKDDDVAAAYARKGIRGSWKRIGELPAEMQREQPIGEKVSFTRDRDNAKVEFKIGPDTRVQTLACDFTGDGLDDAVVERYRAAGSYGYEYLFYRRLRDGAYERVASVQTAGLCALPAGNGGKCGFLTVGKVSNPVLSASLITFENGEMRSEEVGAQPFYMLDVREDRVYRAAPFIGAGFGCAWLTLESEGIWYRPLFWPWTPGVVPGD